jgi:hypothetical protein
MSRQRALFGVGRQCGSEEGRHGAEETTSRTEPWTSGNSLMTSMGEGIPRGVSGGQTILYAGGSHGPAAHQTSGPAARAQSEAMGGWIIWTQGPPGSDEERGRLRIAS